MNKKVTIAMFAMVLNAGIAQRPAMAGPIVFHAANNGRDSVVCGTEEEPCRTINWTVTRAPELAVILVHPGIYGDVDNDGSLVSPGDETPLGARVFNLDKEVSVVSAAGPSSTVFRCPGVGTGLYQAGITGARARLGRKSFGFTLKDCEVDIQSDGVEVSGNIIISTIGQLSSGIGTSGNSNVLIQHNRLVGHFFGIHVDGDDNVLSRNTISGNVVGIEDTGNGTVISGNIVIGNDEHGIFLLGGISDVTLHGAIVTKNSVIGNGYQAGAGSRGGIRIDVNGDGLKINSNNIFGNDQPRDNCGITFQGVGVLEATKNFWGAATGPGADPADKVCTTAAGSLVLTHRHSTRELQIKPLPLK